MFKSPPRHLACLTILAAVASFGSARAAAPGNSFAPTAPPLRVAALPAGFFDPEVGLEHTEPAIPPPPAPRRQGDFPLHHPFTTWVRLNEHGGDVFRQPGAVPYLLLGAVALATDKQTEKWFHVRKPGEKKSAFSRDFSYFGDGKVILPAILVMGVAGKGRERDTAKLWGAAVVNATVFTEALKLATGKERPNKSGTDHVVYHGPSSLKNDSFPSGHMEVATASAVVLGHQYPRLKLLFYALAAGVGVARVEGLNHWPSDVYWGAGMGYYGGWTAIRNRESIIHWRF